MIFVECTIVNLESGSLKGKIYKTFDMIDDFNKWYSIAKQDGGMVINIMNYNPMEKPTQKQFNDIKLLQMSRETAI